MKKILAIVAAAATLAMASCGGSGASIDRPGFDTLFSVSACDTLVKSFAYTAGSDNNLRFAQYMKRDSSLNKKAFIDGFRHAFFADTTGSYQTGMFTANQILAQLAMWRANGINADRDVFFSEFKKAFMVDSVDVKVLDQQREILNFMQRKYNEAMRAYEAAQIANSPEAVDNASRGIAYIDSVAAADPEVKVKASGLAIKVINPGDGQKINREDRVLLHYTSSTPEGRVFDRADSNNARPVSVASRIEGLQEAIQQLGKGAKATIYIPGKLAYGTNTNKRYRLAPNQLVIMDLEIVDVMPYQEAK